MRRRDGRPPVAWTDEIEERLLELLEQGWSLSAITAQPSEGTPESEYPAGMVMPSKMGVLRRLREDHELRKRYELAKMLGIEVLADELCDLADEVPAKKQAVMKARLQIDTRKWLLMKLLPHKYGDTLALKHTGDVHVTLKQFTAKPKPEGTPGG